MVVYQTAFRQVKRYPSCVCSPPCHPCPSHSDFSLGVQLAQRWPQVPSSRASGQSCVPVACSQELGRVSFPWLIRPHAEAEKAAGSLGALLSCYCLFKEEGGRGNMQKVTEAEMGSRPGPRREERVARGVSLPLALSCPLEADHSVAWHGTSQGGRGSSDPPPAWGAPGHKDVDVLPGP